MAPCGHTIPDRKRNKLNDVNVLDILPVEAGAFYVMDRGYVDFKRLYAMHQAGAFFVTHTNRGMDARRVYSVPTACLQILSVSAFEKPQLSCALQTDEPQSEHVADDNQLTLFNF